jgi:hypothetical protein
MSTDLGDLINDSDSEADKIWPNCEPTHRYYDGTYYPICIGDVLHNRYRIIHKLGWGGFSTVWLARDEETNSDVALKILVAGRDGRGNMWCRKVSRSLWRMGRGRG